MNNCGQQPAELGELLPRFTAREPSMLDQRIQDDTFADRDELIPFVAVLGCGAFGGLPGPLEKDAIVGFAATAIYTHVQFSSQRLRHMPIVRNIRATH